MMEVEEFDGIEGEQGMLEFPPPIGGGFGGTSMMGDTPLSKHEMELWEEEGDFAIEDPHSLSLSEIERQKFLEKSQGMEMDMGTGTDMDIDSKMEGDDPTLLPDFFPIPDDSYEVDFDPTSSPSYLQHAESVPSLTQNLSLPPAGAKRRKPEPPKKPTPKRDKKVQSELWTPEEDELLMEKVTETGGKKWKWIASQIEGKNISQCRSRYNILTTSKKGGWTPEENELLMKLYDDARKKLEGGKLKQGRFWSSIASQMGERTNKQVRERWHNVLDPKINRKPFLPEEDQKIKDHVPNWSFLERKLPGRNQNQIKNRWTALKRMERDA